MNAKKCKIPTQIKYTGTKWKNVDLQVNRTVASTNMNATSSRAHTIVGVRWGFILLSVFLHIIYIKQINGCLGTLSRNSVFCIFHTKQIQGSGPGVLFLVSVVLPFCILRSFPPARFTQKSKNAAGKEMEKKSLINIVDLAGRYKEIKEMAPFFFLLFYDRHFQPG